MENLVDGVQSYWLQYNIVSLCVKEPWDVRSFLRALLKGHLFFGQKPEETLNVIQKVLRIDDRKTARETYEDEMRRYNPGGGFEQGNMRRSSTERAKREKWSAKWKFRRSSI
ncbi:MAG: hypothetical protein E6J74_27255 [Deltaproteobacteria bacterium]|nr:MAG: hypothetical protein E6J74_27255 [Deltaproteobacteria bacterium]